MSSYKYIFGPVNSRRFGTSLGIDLSPEKKCCNFDCLYCELSATKVVNAIANPPSIKDIIQELKLALDEFKDIDVITLTANGEPSLYPNLKELIEQINSLKTKEKSLILSNGTAVLKEEKFESLLGLDIVKFSLDSVVQRTFRKIDRSLEKIDVLSLVEKMSEFRAKFKGELVMEVLVLEGLNDSSSEFEALNLALKNIAPSRLDLSTLDRPPAHDVKGVSFEKLYSLSKLITSVPVVIATKSGARQKLDFSTDELRKLLKLRPQSTIDIQNNYSQISKQNLDNLISAKEVKISVLAGVTFYRI